MTLSLGPDRSESLAVGASDTYKFYARLDGDSGGTVELRLPQIPAGWSLRLLNADGTSELDDADRDGRPELDCPKPKAQYWFSLAVQSPGWLAGDTGDLERRTFRLIGALNDRSSVADTAWLRLTRYVEGENVSVHNYPNPLSDKTNFIIGLSWNCKVSLVVYTRTGKRVGRVLRSQTMSAGPHVFAWKAENDQGQKLAPGTYEYVLECTPVGSQRTFRLRKRLVIER